MILLKFNFNFNFLIMENDKKYSKIPEDFLKGIFIEPHNFIDPENKDHA